VAIARKTTSKPLGISKTVRDFGSLTRESEGIRGRPRIVSPVGASIPLPKPRLEPATPERDRDVSLDALVCEWLLELKVMGRSPRTIEWYAQKMRSYLAASNAARLSELTAFELKRFLGELRDRGLAPNTIHGFFETLKALTSWAQREHYPVDADLLRVRAPKVPEKGDGDVQHRAAERHLRRHTARLGHLGRTDPARYRHAPGRALRTHDR